MNRVTAVGAALATAATAAMAAAATIAPAMAAPRTAAAAHPATQAKSATTAHTAKATTIAPTQIASELDGGKYVTIVTCRGVDSPPPIQLGKPTTPLIVSGTGPSATVFKMLKQQDPYKNIYTCTVLVKERVPATPRPAVPKRVAAHKLSCEIVTVGHGWACTKKVTLNTGFGGLARQVKDHHPAG
jgi:hypothetical protein